MDDTYEFLQKYIDEIAIQTNKTLFNYKLNGSNIEIEYEDKYGFDKMNIDFLNYITWLHTKKQ